jgi:hypothetical protein
MAKQNKDKLMKEKQAQIDKLVKENELKILE